MQHKEMIIIGGGQSGITMALGAAKLGVRVLLIERNDLLSEKCTLAQNIMRNTFLEYTKAVSVTRSLTHSDLGQAEIDNLFTQVRNGWRRYPRMQIMAMLDDLGVEIWLGEAKAISQNVIAVGGRVVTSKRIVIATGIEEQKPHIPGIETINYRTCCNIFERPLAGNKISIVGGTVLAMEYAQSLANLGKEVLLIILPGQNKWEKEVFNKIKPFLEEDGVTIYYIDRITEAYRQNKRNILVCEDDYEHNLTLDAHEVLFANTPVPQAIINIMPLGLALNANGIWTNARSKTSLQDVYAVGSVANARTPYFNIEEQTSVALHNCLIQQPRRAIKARFTVKMINTSPGYIEVGDLDNKKVKELKAKLSHYDKPYYGTKNSLEVTWLLRGGSVVGYKAFGSDIANVMSNLMHTINPEENLWSFARTPHIPGTISHSLRKMVESSQPDSFFPSYIGALVRISDRILMLVEKIGIYARRHIAASTRKLRELR